MIVATHAIDIRSPFPHGLRCAHAVPHVTSLDNCVKELPPKTTPVPQPTRLQKKHRSTAKRVSFSDCVAVAFLKDLSAEDVSASWLQRDDIRRIKQDTKLCVVAYHKVGRRASRLPLRYCIRGLESATSRLGVNHLRRKEAVSTVLLAQQGSRLRSGRSDPELLRVISEIKSQESVRDAVKTGARDSRIWIEEYRSLF